MLNKYKNIIIIVTIFIVLLSISLYKMSYNNNKVLGINNKIALKTGINNKIALKTGILPSNAEVIGVKDDCNFYMYSSEYPGSISIYNTKNNKTTEFTKPVNSNNSISICRFSDKWITWVEKEKSPKDNLKYNWAIYVQNLDTGKVKEIERSQYDFETSKIPYKFSYSPTSISLSGDKVVYQIFDKTKNNDFVSLIKLYDLSKDSMSIIETLSDNKNQYLSEPSIDGKNIVWGTTTVIDKNKINGKIFLYNIESKEKKQIDNDNRIFKPIIKDNIVLATFLKPNEKIIQTNIVMYNLNDKKWKNIINDKLDIYKGNTSLYVDSPMVSNNYLIWWDNLSKNACIYSLKDDKLYDLTDGNNKNLNDIFQVRFIDKNIVFWKNWHQDKSESVHIYTVLK